MGFVAQEVPKEFVEKSKDDGGMLSISYPRIVTALVRTIQDLEARVKELEDK